MSKGLVLRHPDAIGSQELILQLTRYTRGLLSIQQKGCGLLAESERTLGHDTELSLWSPLGQALQDLLPGRVQVHGIRVVTKAEAKLKWFCWVANI